VSDTLNTVDQLCSQLACELTSIATATPNLKSELVAVNITKRLQEFQTEHRCFKELTLEQKPTILQATAVSISSGTFSLSYDQYRNLYCTYKPYVRTGSIN
jgi:hypothetical protein